MEFNQIVKKFNNQITSAAHLLARKVNEDMDDIRQEFYIAIYKALPSYNSKYQMSTFIATVVRNAGTDTLRNRMRLNRKFEEYANFPRYDYYVDDRPYNINLLMRTLDEVLPNERTSDICKRAVLDLHHNISLTHIAKRENLTVSRIRQILNKKVLPEFVYG